MVAKKKFLLLLFVSLVCSSKTEDAGVSINAFSIDLLKTTIEESASPRNLGLSTYSIWTLLSVIHEGSGGETAKQLERVLRIPGISNKMNFRKEFQNLSNYMSAEEKDVNNLYQYKEIFTPSEYKLRNLFSTKAQLYYDINIKPVNFTDQQITRDIINARIGKATKNKVVDFLHLDDLKESQIMIVSVSYFKPTWMSPFNISNTKRDPFYDEKGNKLGEVNMMHQMGSFAYSILDWIKGYAVELPCGKEGKISMILILPYKDHTVQGTLHLMSQTPFSQIIDTLDRSKEESENEDINVFLPRFGVKSDFALNLVLNNMGASDIFNSDKSDLLGIFTHYSWVSRIFQRADIDVYEGDSVTSDTSVSASDILSLLLPQQFVANRPFLFFIVNKPTKSVMFAGKISYPP